MPNVQPLETHHLRSLDTPVAILNQRLHAIADHAGLSVRRIDTEDAGKASVALLRLPRGHVAMLMEADGQVRKTKGATLVFEGQTVGQHEISDLMQEFREALAMPGLGISWQNDASRRHDLAETLSRPGAAPQPGLAR